MAVSPRRDVVGVGSVPGAALLVLLLALTTAVCSLGPRAAHPARTPGAAPPAAAVPAGPAAAGPIQATAPAEAALAVPAGVDRGGAPRPAVRTMSMDAPIQGGLTAHQAQAVSARVRAAHGEVGMAAATGTWTPAMGLTAVARARSWLGLPYAWAGGNAAGPTVGRCDRSAGADLDCHIIGMDCSGLMMYAWGPYASLPHFAQTQREAGEFHPRLRQLRPGDMVFFSGYLPDGIGHVAIYEGNGTVIEAPQSGAVVRRSSLAELMAHNGTYRGAVRPLTAPSPVLAAPATTVPHRGGLVTLRGSHLSGVTSATVGTRTVGVVRRTDTTVTVRVPRSPAGRHLTVSVTTSWDAASAPVTLTYAAQATQPKPTPSEPAPTKPTPTEPTPTKPAPTKPAPTKPAPTKQAPKPTPTPTQSGTAVPAPDEPTDR